MPESVHLSFERLSSETQTEEEREHLSSCRQCREEVRWQDKRSQPEVVGRYRVVGWLGSGGMAQVQAAVDEGTGERVALKRLVLPTAQMTERLLREAVAQRAVVHEHVLAVREVLELPNGPVLVLPFTRGPSLEALLSHASVSLPQRLALLRQVIEGVAAVHRAGLVHRDLKPGNVLLDATGDRVLAKVADFGLVKGTGGEALTQTGAGLGTPQYMAPEQRQGAAQVDARADVYSLGVMLVELLTGERKTVQHRGDSPWDALARQMLAPSRDARPADAAAVLAQLPETEEVSEDLRTLCLEMAPTLADDRQELPEIRCRLPLLSDAFVGRHEELGSLAEVLASERMVSVVGPAGVGKTRLCVRYAGLWLEDYPGGAFFCDLSEARDADGIVMAVARGLDVPLGKGDPVERLGHAIRGLGRCLVILDNFEQVAAHAEETLQRWYTRATDARLLVTTRAPLGLQGERRFELSLLSQPDAESLFMHRAQSVHPAWRPSAQDTAAITELVALLDCLPLAIELAAARIAVMAPSDMLSRMGERFRLLAAGGRRDRHATLRGALDWSFALLTEDERAALCQLSVFRGGFSLEAVGAVLRLEQTEPSAAVRSLVDKSLARSVSDGRGALLMSVAQYALGKLPAQERAAAEERHGAFFARLGSDEVLDAPVRREAALRRLEIDNLVAASRCALARGDGEIAASTALAAWSALGSQGPFSVVADLLEGVLQSDKARRARLICAAGEVLWSQGRMDEARARFEAALSAAREVGNLRFEGLGLGNLGLLHHAQGRLDEARACYEAALVIHRAVGNQHSLCALLANLGLLHKQQGRMDDARAHLEEALLVARATQNREQEGSALGQLGALDDIMNRPDEACVRLEAALRLLREVGSRRIESGVLGNLGRLYFHRGRVEEAHACIDASLRLLREVGDRLSEGIGLDTLATLHMEEGRLGEARACCEAALVILREVGARRNEGNTCAQLGVLHERQGEPDEARRCYEAALVIHQEVGDLRFEGITLGNLGALHRAQGRTEEAEAHLEAALAIHRRLSNRRYEGFVLGQLALLSAASGRLDEARARFDSGAALLRQISDPQELGKLLAQRAVVERGAGDPSLARALIAEAEQLAEGARSRPDSELGRAIAAARAPTHSV